MSGTANGLDGPPPIISQPPPTRPPDATATASPASAVRMSAEEYQELVRLWTRRAKRAPDFPRKLKLRLVALHYFQMAFSPNAVYSEDEVDRAIQDGNIFATDHVQVRRHLIDYGMLQRTASADQYRLCDSYLSLASWDPTVLVCHADGTAEA